MFDPSKENAGAHVPQTELLAHPAVRAWRSIGPERPLPTGVGPAQFKRHAKRTNIYRLEDAAPGGGAVIAKSCRPGYGATERILYEEYLSNLPVRTPGYLGCVEDPATSRLWVFMRELRGEPYAHDDRRHREYAARWLGALHVGAQAIGRRPGLPAADSRRYLEHLRHTRELIDTHRDNPVLMDEDREFLELLLRHYDEIERVWNRMEDYCAAAPHTLVHGDFNGKNVFVQSAGEPPGIAVFDWEFAGWGPPAVDLAQFEGHAKLAATPDLATYFDMVRDLWPKHDRADVERLANCGTLFRSLAVLDWESFGLAHDWARRQIVTMRLVEPDLRLALHRLGAVGRSPLGQ
jgi:thiamine kinase-like enzyme